MVSSQQFAKTFSDLTGLLTGRLQEDPFKGGILHEYEIRLYVPHDPSPLVRLAGIWFPRMRSWKQLAGTDLRLRPNGFDLFDGENIPSTGTGQLHFDGFEQMVTVERLVLSRHPSDVLKLEMFLELSETSSSYGRQTPPESVGTVLFEIRGTVDIGDVRVPHVSWPSAQTLLVISDYQQIAEPNGITLRPRA